MSFKGFQKAAVRVSSQKTNLHPPINRHGADLKPQFRLRNHSKQGSMSYVPGQLHNFREKRLTDSGFRASTQKMPYTLIQSAVFKSLRRHVTFTLNDSKSRI